jgi:hypothetical protein
MFGVPVPPGEPSNTTESWSVLVRTRRGTYGYAVVLNRIEVLTPDDYSEQEIARIDTAWLKGSRATHTYNSNSRYEVGDAQRLVGSPSRRGRSSLEPLSASDVPRAVFNCPGTVRSHPLLSPACASPMRIQECGSGLTRETN